MQVSSEGGQIAYPNFSVYHATKWDWSMFLGSIGLFLFLLCLFIRYLPMISIFEMRTLLPEAQAHGEAHE